MNKLLSIVNYRTVIMLAVAFLSVWLAIRYDIRIHLHLMLYSLLIAFPIVFSLQSAFKRREKALEYMSKFKSGLQTSWLCLLLSKEITPDVIDSGKKVFTRASNAMMDHLSTGQPLIQDVYGYINDIQQYLIENRSAISGGVALKITRYMKDVYESIAYLASQKTHRTMAVLRWMSFVFIHLFPIFQAGVLLPVLKDEYPSWTIYLISAFTSLVLITLYNMQHNMEYAFDQRGFDDIKVDEFRINLK